MINLARNMAPTPLKHEQHYTRSLIEASMDSFITINPQGLITDVNEASIRVTGVPRNLIIGTNFSNYFTEPLKAEAGYQKAFEIGFVTDCSLTIKHIQGSLTRVLCNASSYKDLKGNVLGVFAVARDINEQKWAINLENANKELLFQNEKTEKRAAELILLNKSLLFQINEKEKRESELTISNTALQFQIKQKEKQQKENKKLQAMSYSLEMSSQYTRSLIEASLDPLITINPEGKITDMNAATLKLTGISRKKLCGSDFYDYFTDQKKAQKVYQEIFAKGSVAHSPLTIRHKNGELTDVLFNGSVYKDSLKHIIGVMIVARDITEQKKTEAELINAKVLAEFTTVVAERAKRKAERAVKIAEEAVKSKQRFLSNMSHEIRTPMNAIIGFTKVALKTELTEKQREYLTAIKVSGDAMIVLINDILDLAKVNSGKLVFEETPFKMRDSMTAMLHLFEPKIQEKNILLFKEYDDSIPDFVIGDPVRLHQIILNLVSNAVKFTSRGQITLKVVVLAEDETHITILFTVQDTGIGISADKIEKIFENFQQASSSTSKIYGGTGLGLAIVKKLVESQGGKITVKSELGVGSSFSFSLSFLKTTEKAPLIEETMDLDPEIKNIRILVVEDIPINQLLMKSLLDDFEFECEIAENGKSAIKKLEKSHYDIILMDLQMPVMNGFETTEYIRRTLKSTIPIMALTADVTTVDLERCEAAGMNDYLSKPVDDKLLYSKIQALIKNPTLNKLHRVGAKKHHKPAKVTNLTYLKQITKSNSSLMMEIIDLYLDQTPTLIEVISEGFKKENWSTIKSAAHKMIPSFAIMGIEQDAEDMARRIQHYRGNSAGNESISTDLKRLVSICTQACNELELEYAQLKKL